MLRELIEEQGFAVIPDVLGPSEVTGLLARLDTAGFTRSKAGLRHALRLPVVAELAENPKLMKVAREILGRQAIPFRATLFDKSLVSNWLVVWHQDTALPLRARVETPGWGPWSLKNDVNYAHAPASALRQILALRIHLDDSKEQNGPLRALPGSHSRGVLSDDEIHEFTALASPVDCIVQAGGILVMRPLIVHSSSKSRTGDARRVLHIEYAASLNIADGLELAIC